MAKKIGRYQQKMARRLVPTRYDKDSRAFNEGAHRHWPNHMTGSQVARQVAIDAYHLRQCRAARV